MHLIIKGYNHVIYMNFLFNFKTSMKLNKKKKNLVRNHLYVQCLSCEGVSINFIYQYCT